MCGSATGKLSSDGRRRLPGAPLRVEAVEPQSFCVSPAHSLGLPEYECREPTVGQRFDIRPGDEDEGAGLEERHSLIRNSERASSANPGRPH